MTFIGVLEWLYLPNDTFLSLLLCLAGSTFRFVIIEWYGAAGDLSQQVASTGKHRTSIIFRIVRQRMMSLSFDLVENFFFTILVFFLLSPATSLRQFDYGIKNNSEISMKG